jgi:hypothetical protein
MDFSFVLFFTLARSAINNAAWYKQKGKLYLLILSG